MCSHWLASMLSFRYKQPFLYIPIGFQFSTFTLPFWTPTLISSFSYLNYHYANTRLTKLHRLHFLSQVSHSPLLVAQDDTWLQRNLYAKLKYIWLNVPPMAWDHNVRLDLLNNLSHAMFVDLWLTLSSNHQLLQMETLNFLLFLAYSLLAASTTSKTKTNPQIFALVFMV